MQVESPRGHARHCRRCAAAEVATIAAMDYGLCLPNYPAGATSEGIDAAADAAERLGWSTVWTTDHVLVDHTAVDDYGRIYEAILTLAWVGATTPGPAARARASSSSRSGTPCCWPRSSPRSTR